MQKLLLFFLGVFLYNGAIAQSDQTFTNPLLPSGPDPYTFYKDGYYYYTHTLGNRIGLWKTRSLADLKTAEYKTIFVPPSGTAYSKEAVVHVFRHNSLHSQLSRGTAGAVE